MLIGNLKMTSTHSSSVPHRNSVHNSTANADTVHALSYSANTGFSNNKLEGSLKTLVNAMNNVRNSMQTPNALQSIASSEKISAATVPKILNNVTGLAARTYAKGTFNMNATQSGSTHRNSGELTGTDTAPVPEFTGHVNSGKSYHGNTADTSLKLREIRYEQSYSYSVSTPSGKALLTKRNEIFNAMNNKKISSTMNKAWSWTITGNTHAQHSSCSRNLKKNVQPYVESALEIIDRTEIVSFRYKDDPDQILHYSFIAEDTDSALATEFHDRMDYTNCIGLLIKAVQELKQEVDRLKSDHSI